MPRPRFARLDPARRRQILERAAEEFAVHGYQHASLNHIIEALGLNKGVFYYYFDGKADLFAAVMRMVWETAMPAGVDLDRLTAETFWPTLRHLLNENHRRMREQPWLAGILRLMLQPAPAADADAVIADQLGQAHAWGRQLLRRGQEVGTVRTDLPVDLLLDIVTRADQAADRWLLANWDLLSPEQREEMGARTFDLWRRIADPAIGEPAEASTS